MKRSVLLGGVIIGFAISLGSLVSLVLYRWEQAGRAAVAAAGFPSSPSPAASFSRGPSATEPPPSMGSLQPTESFSSPSPAMGSPVSTQPVAALAGPIAEGQAVFGRLCDACHPGAGAGFGPALIGSAFELEYGDDSALIAVIRQGENGMPAFPVPRLSETELQYVIAFMRSLGGAAPGVTGGKPEATSTEVPLRGEMSWTGSYDHDIQPLFDEFCVRCHGSVLAENGLRLDTYEGAMRGTQGGAVVIPGSASSSTLVWVIQGLAAPEIRMPHAEHPLSPNRIQNIILWIDAGAPQD